MTPDLTGLVRALSGSGVRYIIVGGVAASLHGALRTTLDLDVVYARDPENVARLVRALARYTPYLRGAPPGLPFQLDEGTVARGLNFTLVTTLGDLDLLGEVTGGGELRSAADGVRIGAARRLRMPGRVPAAAHRAQARRGAGKGSGSARRTRGAARRARRPTALTRQLPGITRF